MTYDDLRGFIAQVDALGALRRVEGADPVLEVGGITELAAGLPDCPALLFGALKGHAPGFRIFTNATVSAARAALALGIDPALPPLDALREWKRKRKELTRRPPATGSPALFLENSRSGAEVDLGLFPAPIWHRGDGGPFIGSGLVAVMRDPESLYVNASVYRVQMHDRRTLTVQFDHGGRHGAIIARKYWGQGKPAPVAIVNPDPALFVAGFEYLPEGASEYDFAGAIRGRPLEVAAAPVTGLPVPAAAEIVFEGALLPLSETSLPEGPFGEFTGYYAAEKRPAPVLRVEAAHWRTDPILLGSPPMKPPRFHFGLPLRAAGIWDNLEAAGVTDIAGVWQHVAQLMTVVALTPRYAGHAKRAGLIAAAQSYMARLVVTVDEDVDPSDLADVMWAVATRAEPAESIDIVRQAWSSALDPRLAPEARACGDTAHSKMIIDATKPYAWRERFPPTSALSESERRAIAAKWGEKLR